MTEPVPESAPEALSRIGNILADAERQVTEIVADAERQSAETHAVSRRMLEARAAELADIAAGIAASAAAAQTYLNRLHGLPPLDLPQPGPVGGPGAPAAGAAVVPEPASAPSPAAIVASTPDAQAPSAPAPPAQDEPSAQDERSAQDEPSAQDERSAQNADESARSNAVRPAEWSDHGDRGRATFRGVNGTPTLVPDVEANEDEDAAADADADAGAEVSGPGDPEPDARGTAETDDASASPAKTDDGHAELPIVAGSHGTDYGSDAPEKVDSARLVALSMAANGRSREEVEAHVRDELGIVDHAALIDYVFGISAPSSIVPSWPPRRRRR